MTDPVDHEASTGQPPPATSASQPGSTPAPAVEWAQAPSAGDTTGTAGRNRVMDIVVWVVALAALALLSLIQASLSGTTGSTRIGYVIGTMLAGLLISAAARWVWVRARRRNHPTARFLSPWIAIWAVILVTLSTFGGSRN
jgi:hypothetical protein